ncbi:ABC transporter permease [Enterococcus sp. CSURQ0835]|uniref:ABC transporter permease n=1 Tax=Enterococcus sp. CSURQ0835 TaxID=2681394 RepID=UPI001356E1CA|nr:ABC transporter permease [Enterococcus sp. CSURQ0835]
MRYKAIVKRVMLELVRDKRTLLLMMLAPLVIISLMKFVFDTNTEVKVKLGYYDLPQEITTALPASRVTLKKYPPKTDVKHAITTDDLAAFITVSNDRFVVTYENADPNATNQIKNLLQAALAKGQLLSMQGIIKQQAHALKKTAKLSQISGQASLPAKQATPVRYTITNHYVYGNGKTQFFDQIFPILIVFFVFFFVFLISGISLLRERATGTLERVLATPVKRSEIIFGYLTGYGLFAIIQTVLIVAFSILILSLNVAGSIGLVLIVNILTALVALAMGIFISTFATSEFQMMQFIPLVVIPQIFFAGLIPTENMAGWVQVIGKLLPLSYSGAAQTKIMIKGQGLSAIISDLGMLLLFLIFFTTLNIMGLKKYRKV